MSEEQDISANKPRFRIATKFNLLAMALVLMTAGAIALIVTQQQRDDRYQALIHHGIDVAKLVAEISEFGIYTEDSEALRRIIRGVRDEDVVYMAFLDRDGKVIEQGSFGPSLKPPAVPAKLASQTAPDTLVNEFKPAGQAAGFIDLLAPVVSRRDAQVLNDDLGLVEPQSGGGRTHRLGKVGPNPATDAGRNRGLLGLDSLGHECGGTVQPRADGLVDPAAHVTPT